MNRWPHSQTLCCSWKLALTWFSKCEKERKKRKGGWGRAQNFPESTDWGKARVYDWASQDSEKSPWLVIVLWQRWRWGNASVNGEGHFRSEPRSTNAHPQQHLVTRTLPPHHQNISLINGCHKNHTAFSTPLTSLQSWTCPRYCKQLFRTSSPQLTRVTQYDMPFHVPLPHIAIFSQTSWSFLSSCIYRWCCGSESVTQFGQWLSAGGADTWWATAHETCFKNKKSIFHGSFWLQTGEGFNLDKKRFSHSVECSFINFPTPFFNIITETGKNCLKHYRLALKLFLMPFWLADQTAKGCLHAITSHF